MLAGAGTTEVQLLGQTVNSYRDPSPRGLRFSELLVAVSEVPGLRRVRFTTSHPRDLGPDIVAAMDGVPAICEHLHLPVQSGSTRVLEAMQRGYTREEYLAKLDLVRSARRTISVTTDIIVGFPGETPHDFEQTLSLLDAAQFDGVFAFQYSPRPNTTARTMPGACPSRRRPQWPMELLERQRGIQGARNELLVGKEFEVVFTVEGVSRRESQWLGRTSSNRSLNFTSSQSDLLGRYLRVRITSANVNSLVGVHSI